MDMLYPGMPVQHGPANNYASPLKHGVTPSVNQAQNTMNLEKPSMVPDEDKVEFRSNEDADKKEKKKKKQQHQNEQSCVTCNERRLNNADNDQYNSKEAYLLLKKLADNLNSDELNDRGKDRGNNRLSDNGKDVIINNLVFRYKFCPECGKPYICPESLSSAIRLASASEKLGSQYQTGFDMMPRGASINTEV